MELHSVSRNLHRDRSVNQAFGRELKVLETLAHSDDPVGVVEFAAQLRLPASTTHRMLATLLREGYVRQDGNRKYQLGSKILALAGAYIGKSGLRKTALHFLQRLKQQTGETVYLVVKDGPQGICVESLESPDHMRISLSVGGRFDLYYSAGGKVFLAEFTDAELASYMNETPLQRFTPRTLVTLARLRGELRKIRRLGFAVDDEEHFIGIRCIAAPVRDFRHRTVAALAIGGPSTRITKQQLDRLGKITVSVANDLSSAMGETHASRRRQKADE